MLSFLIRILGNGLALFAASWFVEGFNFTGGIKEYAIAGIVLALLNMIARPILKLIAMPVIILTLGLFILVINALLLWSVDYIFDFIAIADFTALAWATIVIGLVNLIVSGVRKAID